MPRLWQRSHLSFSDTGTDLCFLVHFSLTFSSLVAVGTRIGVIYLILKKLHELLFSIVFNSIIWVWHNLISPYLFIPPCNKLQCPPCARYCLMYQGYHSGKDTIPILIELVLKYVSYFRYYWKFSSFKIFPNTNNFQWTSLYINLNHTTLVLNIGFWDFYNLMGQHLKNQRAQIGQNSPGLSDIGWQQPVAPKRFSPASSPTVQRHCQALRGKS